MRLTALFPSLPRWAGTRKVKTNLDFTEARDSEWQWHQLGHMQACTSLQTDNHASTHHSSFFTGRMPFLPPNQQCQSTEDICHSENTTMDINTFLKYSCNKTQWMVMALTGTENDASDKCIDTNTWKNVWDHITLGLLSHKQDSE